MHNMLPLLQNHDFPSIQRSKISTLQLNLGYLCNLSCSHCHVNASPKRTELMSKAIMDLVLEFALQENISCLDLTGGAPEMNPEFRYLVTQATANGIKVIDRCNLVILVTAGYTDLTDFLASNKVEIIASLPCYLADNVDKQRGNGTFAQSIQALQKLNSVGYAQDDSKLTLNLVFNPQGTNLAPPQAPLELAYKQHLHQNFGIIFNKLLAMNNVPIQRFGSQLVSKNEFQTYMQLLQANYQAKNLDNLMCKSTLSIDWQGYVYDCDFNQMLALPLGNSDKKIHLRDLKSNLKSQPINTLAHCYACTAGQGSSCGGALQT